MASTTHAAVATITTVKKQRAHPIAWSLRRCRLLITYLLLKERAAAVLVLGHRHTPMQEQALSSGGSCFKLEAPILPVGSKQATEGFQYVNASPPYGWA